jgi:hypothetical protein
MPYKVERRGMSKHSIFLCCDTLSFFYFNLVRREGRTISFFIWSRISFGKN